MALDYYEIRILNRSSVKTAFISSSAGRPPVINLSFAIDRLGGCGAFEMTATRDSIQGTVGDGYLLDFYAAVDGGALTRYYRGYIVAQPGAGTTAERVRYQAKGLWHQLTKRLIVKYYDADDTSGSGDIDDLVKDLITAEFAVSNDISTSTTEVSIGTPYTLGDAEFEYVKASDALKILAEAQKDVVYGVDQDGKVYFKDISTALGNRRYWVGKHIERFEPVDRSDGRINSVVIQSKRLVGGGMITLAHKDATSITAYGERQKIIQIPHLDDPNDAFRIAENYVVTHKDARTAVAVRIGSFQSFEFPNGNVRIVALDGTTTDLPIQRVNYTISDRGFEGRYDVGDEISDVPEELRNVLRDIEVTNRSSISLTQIAHTRGEAFRQEALKDSRKQGNYNLFTDAFTSLKGLDEDGTIHAFSDQRRSYVGCGFEYDEGQYLSNIIPTGKVVDTIRVHLNYDAFGRVLFSFDDDLADFFLNTTYWIPDDVLPRVKNDSVDSFMYYKDDGAAFALGNKDAQGFGFQDPKTGETKGFLWYYAYADASNFNYISITNGASNCVFKLFKVVSGTPTQVGSTYNGLKDADYEVTVEPLTSPSNHTISIWRAGSIVGTISGQAPNPGGPRVGPTYWAASLGTDYLAYLNYVDIRPWTIPITVDVSRDGGTSWTSVTAGYPSRSAATGLTAQHVDVTVSGQPSGTDVRLRAKIKHPVRLFGWGVSFKNA